MTSGRSKTNRWPWWTTSTRSCRTAAPAPRAPAGRPRVDRLVELDHDRRRLGRRSGTRRTRTARSPRGRGGRPPTPRARAPGAGSGGCELVVVEPGGVDGRVAELVARDQGAQEAGVGGEPEDRGVVERGDQCLPGRLAVGSVGDHLAEHRVVRRGHDLPALERLVDRATPARPLHDTSPCRPAAGSRRTSPRRRPAPRSRGRSARRRRSTAARRPPPGAGARPGRCPPHTSSVTGCSTWSRVFISRK